MFKIQKFDFPQNPSNVKTPENAILRREFRKFDFSQEKSVGIKIGKWLATLRKSFVIAGL